MVKLAQRRPRQGRFLTTTPAAARRQHQLNDLPRLLAPYHARPLPFLGRCSESRTKSMNAIELILRHLRYAARSGALRRSRWPGAEGQPSHGRAGLLRTARHPTLAGPPVRTRRPAPGGACRSDAGATIGIGNAPRARRRAVGSVWRQGDPSRRHRRIEGVANTGVAARRPTARGCIDMSTRTGMRYDLRP